jgi:hypothetical protein
MKIIHGVRNAHLLVLNVQHSDVRINNITDLFSPV